MARSLRPALPMRRKYKRLFISAGLVTTASLLGFTGHYLSININNANATEQQTVGRPTGGYIFENIPVFNLQVEADNQLRGAVSAGNDIIGVSQLPTSYDSRALGYVSRQENQVGEGLCWAYSFTTTAESYLLRTGLVSNAVELSAKQLDYALAPASQAFSDSSVNKYEDYAYALTGSHRNLTDGSNYLSALAVTSGKYSTVEDDAFFNKMKLNDPATLGSFNSYGEFILNRYELAYADWLANEGHTDLPITYTTKQKIADVFDRGSAAYAITGAEFIDLGYYTSGDISSDRTEAIAQIKNDIFNYGAVAIASHYNEDSCMYKDGNNYTIIDRTTMYNSGACNDSGQSTGHGMTLVGWNDDWAYEDNGVAKTGAFILQNSYGDDGINYYFSYNSYALATAVTDMERANSFDDVFDASDFVKTVDADNYEVTFEFNANGTREIKQISAFVYPLTDSPDVKWGIYVKSGDGEYEEVGNLGDDGNLGLRSVDNLAKSVTGNFSIKIKYNSTGYIINGLTSTIFAQVASYVSAVAYTDDIATTPTTEPGPNQDPEPTPEPEPTPTTDPEPTQEELIEEPNGTVTNLQGEDHIAGDGANLTFRIDYALEFLESVSVDDILLTSNEYEAQSGSTIIIIYSNYLDTLNDGNHTASVAFTNGETVNVNFTTSSESLPVPNTSATDEETSGAPDTGYSTSSHDGIAPVVTYVVPVAILAIVLASYTVGRSKHRVDFRK